MHFRLPRNDRFPIRRQAGGYCAEGPGFYVWDEDPQEVSRLAHEFGSRSRAPGPGGPETASPDGSRQR